MATTSTNGWKTYAILQPSKPTFNKQGNPVEWKVQTNDAGQWRCYCPSFIFSGRGGTVKTCKHIRHCQQELQQQMTTKVAVPQPIIKAVPSKPPTWDSAYAITTAMIDHARLIVNATQREALVKVLAEKLTAFVPPPTVRVTVAPVAMGVRYITFDE